jgi:hypothetical protein
MIQWPPSFRIAAEVIAGFWADDNLEKRYHVDICVIKANQDIG